MGKRVEDMWSTFMFSSSRWSVGGNVVVAIGVQSREGVCLNRVLYWCLDECSGSCISFRNIYTTTH